MRRALILLAVGLLLFGVGGMILFPELRSDILEKIPGFGPSNKKVTLQYWGLWEPKEVIQPLLDEYQRQNPNVTIEYEQRNPEKYYRTVKERLKVEGSPDIVRLHASWIPFMTQRLAPVPSGVMSTEEYEKRFFPVNRIFLKKQERYYAIPLMIDGLALVYNRDLFEQEGISEPPADWKKFREYANRLTKTNSEGEVVQAGAALGYAANVDYFSDILGLLFAQNGVKFMDNKGKISFHSTISEVGGNLGVEALRFYTLFANQEQSWSPDFGNSTLEFTRGKVAMVFIPSHRLHEILSAQPGFEIGVAKVPQLPTVSGEEEEERLSWANYWVESVARVSPYKKEAWEFLKWMTEKEQLTKFYRTASQVRAFGEPYPRSDMVSALDADKYTLAYVEQGEEYTTHFFNYGTFDGQTNERIVSSLQTMVEDLARGRADAKGALDRAAGQIQLILDNAASD